MNSFNQLEKTPIKEVHMITPCSPYRILIKLIVVISIAVFATFISQSIVGQFSIINLFVFVITYAIAIYFYPKPKDCQL